MSDLESRMSDVGCCRMSDVECRTSNVGSLISDVGSRISDDRSRISDIKWWMSDGTYTGFRTSGLVMMGFLLWKEGSGKQNLRVVEG